MYWILYTNLQNKTYYRRFTRFGRSQKIQHKYIVSKSLSRLETFPNNLYAWDGGGGGGWNKNVLGRKESKI